MQRRKFLIGAGALAAGSAAAVGSGAFTAMQAGRDADIDVVNDASGLIALDVGPDIGSDVVREENGELTIDFTAGGSAGGINIDSRYQVGTFVTGEYPSIAEPLEEDSAMGSNYAFSIINQDTVSHTLGVKWIADDIDAYEGCELFLHFAPTDDSDYENRDFGQGNHGNGKDGFTRDVASGEGYYVSILVDTRGATADPEDIDLSGTLRVSAN